MEPGAMAMAPGQPSWEYSLRKYLLLLATLVVTVTYAAGFNPPGGVWQDSEHGHLNGDPIIRTTHYARYLVFFYCNATAFASSLVVIVLILVLAFMHDKQTSWVITSDVLLMRFVMVVDLLSLMGAYAAGTCRDTLTTVCSSAIVAVVFAILVAQMVRAWRSNGDADPGGAANGVQHLGNSHPETAPGVPNSDDPDPRVIQDELRRLAKPEERFRKVLMLLATFAASVTYGAGLSAPGGFWDRTGGRHHPGDAILMDEHGARLKAFLVFNTMAFVGSLLIIVILLDKKLRERAAGSKQLYGCIIGALIGLAGAYAAGSCRKTDTTVYVVSLGGAVLLYMLLHWVYTIRGGIFLEPVKEALKNTCLWRNLQKFSTWLHRTRRQDDNSEALDKARSLVLLLATLAAAITYTAGLNPPGGVWQDNDGGHKAGDPVLLMTNPRRFKAFFYCNSVAFVASLVAIILVQAELLVKHHVLEVAMILDLFGLIGAYAAGSCRDLNTSLHAMALAGAVLIYVVIHVVFFTLDDNNGDDELNKLLEKRRKRLLLFAILAATITYQAGLTPPGGFLLQDDDQSGHHAGDPVLLFNFPRRYKAFFYCNAVSFMLSIALIITLVNPHLYRPAIRSNALSVCTAAGLFGLMGAYAAGSTQHIKTSIYIFVLVGVVLLVAVVLLLVFVWQELKRRRTVNTGAEAPAQLIRRRTALDVKEAKKHARRKYLMLLGILVASVTYQAGLQPPGGAWQNSSDGYEAGNPVMHDVRRRHYLAFFYSNSTSFVASIVVIMLLLLRPLQESNVWLRVMNTTILLDLFALLGAYAAGSSRGWKTSVYVIALVLAVLGYFVIHMMLSFMFFHRRATGGQQSSQANPQTQGQGNVGVLQVEMEPRV